MQVDKSTLCDGLAVDVFKLQRALSDGDFAAAFADMWNGLGLEYKEEIERVGASIEQMYEVSGKATNVRRRRARTVMRAEVSRLVKRSLKHDDKTVRQTARYFFEWVCDLEEDFRLLEVGRGEVDYARLARAFGAVQACILLIRKEGVPLNMDAVVDLVAQALKKDGIGHSDVRRSIKFFMADIPIDRWIEATCPSFEGVCA